MTFVVDLDYGKHIKPVLDIFKSWPHVDVENITKHDKDVKLKWFGLYTGHKLEDIVALIAIQTNFDDYTINIANICSNGHGNGKKLLDKIIDYYSKTDRKYLVWFADPNGGEKLKNYYRTNFPDAKETEEKNEWWQTSKFTLKLKESYEPPYTLNAIKQKYGDEVYRKLRDDPVHRFRAETGIEVIHKEPTRDEFERIVKNWDLMTPEQKKQSDEFSMKQFGNNNKNRIDLLRKEYDFEVGDKVKIRSGIRCRQSGHTGTIIRIDPPGTYDFDMHEWTSFLVKMDDPNLGTVSFYSGSIEKLDTVKEYWTKNGRYFYCYDCNKNMSKAPDDQYIMIDDDLWEYVCKHGGKKIGTEEDLCRDCIEKRLGRCITLKDLGDKINLPINDEIKKMLKKRKMNESETKFDLSRIPEDSMLDLTEIVEYKGPGFKEYSYLDNCIGGEGTLFDDASEMASWIYNFCQVIPISKVKDRLVGAPSELTNAIKKLEREGKIDDLDEIVCGIDAVKQGYHESEEMMFIYVSDQDTHYFFECSGTLSESLNEAREKHSYPEKLQTIIKRIVKDNEDYELDHAYFNKEGKFIWMQNSKGYLHVFRPVKFVKTPGMTKPFGFKVLVLKDDGTLEEVDRLRFADGNEGLAYLSKKYHLDLRTIR